MGCWLTQECVGQLPNCFEELQKEVTHAQCLHQGRAAAKEDCEVGVGFALSVEEVTHSQSLRTGGPETAEVGKVGEVQSPVQFTSSAISFRRAVQIQANVGQAEDSKKRRIARWVGRIRFQKKFIAKEVTHTQSLRACAVTCRWRLFLSTGAATT